LKKLPILAALLLAGIFAALVFRSVDVRTDMAAFLPAGRTPASQFMLQQLQTGSTASLILLGI
jgi:predicted exporter